MPCGFVSLDASYLVWRGVGCVARVSVCCAWVVRHSYCFGFLGQSRYVALPASVCSLFLGVSYYLVHNSIQD